MPMTSPSSPSTWAADFRRRSSSHARFVVMRVQQQQSTAAATGPVKRKTSLLANMLNQQDQQKVSGFLSLQRGSTSNNLNGGGGSGGGGGKFKLLRRSTTVSYSFILLCSFLFLSLEGWRHPYSLGGTRLLPIPFRLAEEKTTPFAKRKKSKIQWPHPSSLQVWGHKKSGKTRSTVSISVEQVVMVVSGVDNESKRLMTSMWMRRLDWKRLGIACPQCPVISHESLTR